MKYSNLTNIVNLLEKVNNLGVKVSYTDDKLIVNIHKDIKLDAYVLNELRENKDDLLEYLKNQSSLALSLPKKIQITSVAKGERVPLSFSQERLWFIDQLEGSVQYHIPAILRLQGEVNLEALSFALRTIVERHQVLRTLIGQHQGEAYQHVIGSEGWQLEVLPAYEQDRQGLLEWVQALVSAPFVLSSDYKLRAHLLLLEAGQQVLVVSMHHIASDGWSTPILVRELVELYNATCQQRPVELAALPLQYADYALWQREYLSGSLLAEKLSYWQGQLAGVTPLALPTDFARPALLSSRGASVSFQVESSLSEAIGELGRQQGATLYMSLLAAFKVLLYRYTSQGDICVGSSVAGRQQQEVEGLVGFFSNTLALRSRLAGEMSFVELLEQVRETALAAYEHQDVPFEKVVEALALERDRSRSNPLFQVMFVLENTAKAGKLALAGIKLAAEEYPLVRAKFDITLTISETGSGLQLTMVYCSDLYGQATIERMLGHYRQLLAGVVGAPNEAIATLPLLSGQEQKQLLEEFNASAVAYPQQQTIQALFQQQVERSPDQVAVVFEGTRLTYGQLNEQSNQLAHYLLEHYQVGPDELVALCLERSMEMIVAILAVLKAGGAYVPIDAAYPEERIGYMLQDTKARVVLTQQQHLHKLQAITTQTAPAASSEQASVEAVSAQAAPATSLAVALALDGPSLLEALESYPASNPVTAAHSRNLAYVIYTSGTTGRPKGVMIEHASLVDYVYGLEEEIKINTCTGFALLAPLFTDLGNTILYGCLLSGGERFT